MAKKTVEQMENVFDFQAAVGLTKHMGNVDATDRLLHLCHVQPGVSTILEVGCGVGVTAAYIAREYGCRVVGVDILEKMVARAREMAQRRGVAHLTEFRQADALSLPFDGHSFDIVLAESVAAFPADKQRVADEYRRVTRPGGYVGMNETTWLKTPVPDEVAAWASQEVGTNATVLDAGEWRALLENTGLVDIMVETVPINFKTEFRGTIRRYGMGYVLKVWGRTLRLYLSSPETRNLMKGTAPLPANLLDYLGFGLYVGRKAEH
jgi:arsenite methyltransferase